MAEGYYADWKYLDLANRNHGVEMQDALTPQEILRDLALG